MLPTKLRRGIPTPPNRETATGLDLGALLAQTDSREALAASKELRNWINIMTKEHNVDLSGYTSPRLDPEAKEFLFPCSRDEFTFHPFRKDVGETANGVWLYCWNSKSLDLAKALYTVSDDSQRFIIVRPALFRVKTNQRPIIRLKQSIMDWKPSPVLLSDKK